MNYNKLKTPDGNDFQVTVISKKEADSLEVIYSKSPLDDSLIGINHRPAFAVNDGMILYRQFFQDSGYVFPDLTNYQRGIRGETYFETNIQFEGNNEIIVAFSLLPALANKFRENSKTEIRDYTSFEGREFYLLKDSAVVMLRKRTPILSDGYWFSSMRDFDYFYYILSGEERSEPIK